MRQFLLLGLILAASTVTACGGDKTGAQEESASATKESTESASESSGMPAQKENPIVARSMNKDPGPSDEYAVIKTRLGTIKLRFYPKQAPLAVANFKGLAAQGYYDGIIFHRVMDEFMIQGGDPSGTGFQGQSLWGEKFADEFSPALRFDRPGLLAMANSGPATNGSQFFITQVATPHLNDKHTIFGDVMEGMDVVNAIAAVRVDQRNKPLEPVVMESVTIETEGS